MVRRVIRVTGSDPDSVAALEQRFAAIRERLQRARGVPARGARGRRRGGVGPAAARRGPHRRAVRDRRPARLHRPRPGDAPGAARRRPPRRLRDRRRPGVRRAGRSGGRSRRGGVARRSTHPTGGRPCTRRRSARARPACWRGRCGRPSSGGSTSTPTVRCSAPATSSARWCAAGTGSTTGRSRPPPTASPQGAPDPADEVALQAVLLRGVGDAADGTGGGARRRQPAAAGAGGDGGRRTVRAHPAPRRARRGLERAAVPPDRHGRGPAHAGGGGRGAADPPTAGRRPRRPFPPAGAGARGGMAGVGVARLAAAAVCAATSRPSWR